MIDRGKVVDNAMKGRYNGRNNTKKEMEVMAYVIGDACISCGTCADTCPIGAISQGDDKYVIDADQCISCGSCAGACPCEAIQEN